MSYSDVRLLAGLAGLWMLGIGWLYTHHLRLLAVLAFFVGGLVAALLIRVSHRDDTL